VNSQYSEIRPLNFSVAFLQESGYAPVGNQMKELPMLCNRSLGLLAVLAAAGIAAAQPQPAPTARTAFEVATVKFHPEPITSAYDPAVRGERVVAMAITLKDIIQVAYGLRGDQVAGGPAWVHSDHYDLAAKAEGSAVISRAEMRAMLQNLLATRFGLQFHREMREQQVYELVIGKDGPKFKPVEPDAKGGMSIRTTVENALHMEVTRGNIEALASQLSVTAGRHVVDKTGLTGYYAYTLDWFPENRILEPHGDAPSMFAALQEQLGLKLESGKASIDTLVIDGAQKPSEN
jgi:uncharacterized protein (TIGR03435 family)